MKKGKRIAKAPVPASCIINYYNSSKQTCYSCYWTNLDRLAECLLESSASNPDWLQWRNRSCLSATAIESVELRWDNRQWVMSILLSAAGVKPGLVAATKLVKSRGQGGTAAPARLPYILVFLKTSWSLKASSYSCTKLAKQKSSTTLLCSLNCSIS